MRLFVLNILIFVGSCAAVAQETKRLDHIESLQREIAEAMNLKTVFRDSYSEKLMYDFWEDSQELVMIGSRYQPRFTWVNKATCNYLGYTRSELTTIDFLSLIHPQDLEASKQAFERFQNTGKIGFEGPYFLNRYQHKQGHYLPMYWSHVIVNDKDIFLMQASRNKPAN